MASRQLKFAGITYSLSYEVRNLNFDEYILILHGWGANKEIMIKAFGSKFTNFKQIYLDLPGFGASSIEKALKTKEYAQIVQNFIDSLQKKPIIIMGHSFGGKVATLLNPSNLILLSSAGIVTPKPFGVRLKIKIFKFLKFFGFGKLYSLFASKDVAGMSKIMYETLKNVVDEDFTKEFENLSAKTLIFWGKNDTATPLKSGERIHKIIRNSEFFPLDGDHFFFLLHGEFIAKTIENNINQTSNLSLDLDDQCEVSEILNP